PAPAAPIAAVEPPRVEPRPIEPAKPKAGAAKAVARKPAAPSTKPPAIARDPHPAPTETAPATPPPAPIKPPPAKKVSHAGISSNELSALWSTVGNELMHGAGTRLPGDVHDELKRQYTMMRIQQLMGAPQDERDHAADTLQNIADKMAGH
ncbi:MAG TPA: hypothetical protein VFP84_34500, partial [Kofleriaceae bacterium]|nr:hypothetical protein [Kofleriaceae bacterium]